MESHATFRYLRVVANVTGTTMPIGSTRWRANEFEHVHAAAVATKKNELLLFLSASFEWDALRLPGKLFRFPKFAVVVEIGRRAPGLVALS